MVNATFDLFTLVGRITSLPSSIGDCESLAEVCCPVVPRMWPASALYILVEHSVCNLIFEIFRLTCHQIS
jgi:hypothetical protein